jgi:Bacterial dnaA protein helix-turn-helix
LKIYNKIYNSISVGCPLAYKYNFLHRLYDISIHGIAYIYKRKYSYNSGRFSVEAHAQKSLNSGHHAFWEKQFAFGNRFHLHGKTRNEEVISICDGMIDILAACFCVSSKELRSQDRANACISRVRQVGMYITHVALGLNMKEVAAGFSRDPSTVVHACHLIEDLRDDPDFDKICITVERIACAAFSSAVAG